MMRAVFLIAFLHTNVQVYMQLAEDDKVRYKNEMKTWEDHMVEIGRQDLIRRKEKTRRVKATKKKAKSKKSKTAAKKTSAAAKKKTMTKVVKKTTRNTKKAWAQASFWELLKVLTDQPSVLNKTTSQERESSVLSLELYMLSVEGMKLLKTVK